MQPIYQTNTEPVLSVQQQVTDLSQKVQKLAIDNGIVTQLPVKTEYDQWQQQETEPVSPKPKTRYYTPRQEAAFQRLLIIVYSKATYTAFANIEQLLEDYCRRNYKPTIWRDIDEMLGKTTKNHTFSYKHFQCTYLNPFLYNKAKAERQLEKEQELMIKNGQSAPEEQPSQLLQLQCSYDLDVVKTEHQINETKLK